MRQISLLGVVLFVLASGCVAHEKNGDRAAALGDWKTAYREYREALTKEHDSPALKGKFQRARIEAVAGAFRRAQSCGTTNDWLCAVSEAEFALSLDEGNGEIASFNQAAAKALAIQRVQVARNQGASGEFQSAFQNLAKAAAGSEHPEVCQQVAFARAEVVALADAEAERLRQSKSYAAAVSLLRQVVAVDPSKRERLESIEREHEESLAAEYERNTQQGDAALAEKRWGEAEGHFRAALAVRGGGRAERLAQYAGGVARGESAVGRRDFGAAIAAYREAMDSGQDRSGFAANQLRLVEIRPYAIRIRSVFVKPTRPDGRPWVGPPNPLLGKLFKAAATYVAPGVGTVTASAVVDAAERVPPENRPELQIEASLPDGRKLVTRPKKSLYVVYDALFVLSTNYFDDRKVAFRVAGRGDQEDDVGVVEIALKDIIEKQQVALADQSVLSLQLAAEPSDAMVDGMFSELQPARDATNLADSFSMPARNTSGYRITAVEAAAYLGDYNNDLGMDGPPDLQVGVYQGTNTVFLGAKKQDAHQAEWHPSSTWLFIDPNEQLVVRVWDADVGSNEQIIAMTVPAATLVSGRVELKSRNGGYVRLLVEPRRSLPSLAVK